MNEALIVAETTRAMSDGSKDPITLSLITVLGAVVLMIAIAGPIMGLYKDYRKNKAENTKSDTEALLFKQLQTQLTSMAEAIIKLQDERNAWFSKALELETEVNKLKTFELMVNTMKEKLNEKDEAIQERELEIRTLTQTILQMKDQLHALELRLYKDEQNFCVTCKYREPDA